MSVTLYFIGAYNETRTLSTSAPTNSKLLGWVSGFDYGGEVNFNVFFDLYRKNGSNYYLVEQLGSKYVTNVTGGTYTINDSITATEDFGSSDQVAMRVSYIPSGDVASWAPGTDMYWAESTTGRGTLQTGSTVIHGMSETGWSDGSEYYYINMWAAFPTHNLYVQLPDFGGGATTNSITRSGTSTLKDTNVAGISGSSTLSAVTTNSGTRDGTSTLLAQVNASRNGTATLRSTVTDTRSGSSTLLKTNSGTIAGSSTLRSTASNTISGSSTFIVPPDAPMDAVTFIYADRLRPTWIDMSSNETGFVIERRWRVG